MDALQWMGAVRMRVQTAAKNITIIHTTPVHQLMSRRQKLCFISCLYSFWRHPFTAEHPLMRHWCSATFLQTWWRNKLIYISDELRVSDLFWVNYSFFWKFWMTKSDSEAPFVFTRFILKCFEASANAPSTPVRCNLILPIILLHYIINHHMFK